MLQVLDDGSMILRTWATFCCKRIAVARGVVDKFLDNTAAAVSGINTVLYYAAS